MTMLYRLDTTSADIASTFGAPVGPDPWAGGYVAPGNFAPVVTAGREFVAGAPKASAHPRIVPRVWGVPPPPNVPFDGSNAVLIVRNPDSPFWVGNLRNSEFRCLIPATSFMEWSGAVGPDGRRRQRWYAVSDQAPFAFAGVWKDSEVPGFALLTCEANALLRHEGQDRMPVILPPDAASQKIWLHGDWKRAEALLQPYSSSLMREFDLENRRKS